MGDCSEGWGQRQVLKPTGFLDNMNHTELNIVKQNSIKKTVTKYKNVVGSTNIV